MARLRDPDSGCPWDLEQSFKTIAPYTIEEAYEVAEAIRSGDREALKDELGDLLFQVVYYAQMSREDGGFDFDAIAAHEVDKMIRRHPHVFGNVDVADAAAQTRNWEAQKAVERVAKGKTGGPPPSVLDGVARALPALIRAEKLTKRAARVGFDWPTVAEVLAKIEEELAETVHEIAQDAPVERLGDEIGDLLFAVANLARKLDIDPEAALRGTNDKFVRRFHHIEAELRARGKTLADSDLAEMDALWNAAKDGEKETP
jgi:ATP diphosphatase